ncbi:MAG TPA: hypothetical protein PLO16_12600 [Acidocella sp.]|nr:hypothetical protein [Acidocella sp.]
MAANNAKIAQENAAYATRAGEQQASAASLKGAANLGAIRASMAANNVDINTGSSLNVQQSAREQSSLDTQTTMNNALLQAYGYRTQSSNFSAQSNQNSNAGYLSAAGGLLSSASSIGSLNWGTSPSSADPAGALYPSAAAANAAGSGSGTEPPY